MSKLSESSMQLIRLIHDHPHLGGAEIAKRFNTGPITPNNLKLLEQHGYLQFNYTVEEEDGHREGWELTQKGEDVLKYG